MTEPAPRSLTAWRDRIAPRLEAMQSRLAAAGHPVALLAVSKGQPVEAIVAALDFGLTDFGENYAQELQSKWRELEHHDLAGEPRIHFIGQLQSNKVRTIAETVRVWQSVDRPKIAREIAKRAPGATVMAQVNLSGDPNKAGCAFEDLPALTDTIVDVGLHLEGLMGVGDAGSAAATHSAFLRLRAEVDARGLAHCSMGMSGDLDAAIDAGSTMVRVGTALFGPRT